MLLGLLGRLRSSKKARRITACVVVVAALGVAAALYLLRPEEEEEERPTGPLIGTQARGIADGVEFWVNGEEVELRRLGGRVVLLYFWHPHDGKSLASLAHVCELARCFADRRFVAIGLCALSDPPGLAALERAAEALVSEHGIPFRIALDCDAKVHFRYRIDQRGTPYCYVVNGERRIVWEGPPESLTARRLKRLLEKEELPRES